MLAKLLLRVILERMQTKLDREIAQEQAGFRPKRRHAWSNHEPTNHLGESKGKNQKLFFCFIDFTKAFDIDPAWPTLANYARMGFPPHLVQLLRNLYKQQRAAVRAVNLTSEWFRVKKESGKDASLSMSVQHSCRTSHAESAAKVFLEVSGLAGRS